MKAARIVDGQLGILDVPTPEPGYEEALIRISSSGVCHSDLHLARGDWLGVSGIEVLGHEAIGVVAALGPGAERYSRVGDRVILGLGGTGGGYWCGACEYCLRGEPRHCPQTRGIMGTFAEQFCVWAKSLVVLPDTVGDHEAALACGGLTAYGAVKKLFRHQVPPGRWVAIVGAAGGLGHYAVQIAGALGYKVVGIDIGADRLAFVESLGADIAVSADDALTVVPQEVGGVDASLVFSARMAGFNLGLRLLRPKGLFVAVGLPPTSEGNLELNPFEFFARDPTLIYSAVGTVQDMRELVDMASAGQVATHVGRTGALSELDTIFNELEAGKYVGRAIIDDLAG
ncbi:alcohol dehydrogenase catalytic domain-containing protein [Candidatus Poriferisocius sp.]|uniref:alcohol dehydrogenase catalytic domain-containing protein n=1 Tax=Candidatus Poriferisocius sp. TaxID=3101276 RepID=UPI003B02B7D2